MSPRFRKLLGLGPGWDDVAVRTLQVALVAFAALMLKEWLETQEWDAPACAVDATWVAGGFFLVNALFTFVSPRVPAQRSVT
jgi:hypothetical protein